MADNIPLLADLKCGKINCEQHNLSETLYDRPGTTISKPQIQGTLEIVIFS
jgi:hypothetical protein